MDNTLFVDEANPINDLQHVFDHFSFCQFKVLVNDPLKEFTSRDPVQWKKNVVPNKRGFNNPEVIIANGYNPMGLLGRMKN